MPVSVARFLGADSWCKDNDPFCGFTMGTPVTSGCSRATRPGSKVYVECCVNQQSAGDVVQFSGKDCSDLPALRFRFNGNLEDDAGANHGTAHFTPPLSPRSWGPSHDGDHTPHPCTMSAVFICVPYLTGRGVCAGLPRGALKFTGDDYVQLEAPFPSKDTHFTLILWLKPSSIDFGGCCTLSAHAQLQTHTSAMERM